MKFREHIIHGYHRLMQIRDTPHAIAGGVAIGVILGFTPLLGFKTLIALMLAWLLRCSKISAVIAVTFHDILLPVWPVVLLWQYKFGYWILHHHLPKKFVFTAWLHPDLDHPEKFILRNWLHVSNWLNLQTLEVVWPTFIGSLVMSLPLALACYYIALKLVTGYQRRIEESIPRS